MNLVVGDAADGHRPLRPAAAAGSTRPGAVVMVTVMMALMSSSLHKEGMILIASCSGLSSASAMLSPSRRCCPELQRRRVGGWLGLRCYALLLPVLIFSLLSPSRLFVLSQQESCRQAGRAPHLVR